jgi:polysaccharide deacetylase family protein (PEP-CTERM system associated)
LRQTDDILEMLAAAGARATFFMLGLVVQAHPTLARRIQSAGHEIGSHGMSHRLVFQQTPEAFREETITARKVIEDAIGGPVLGYRAAEFSITRQSLWALDVLAEAGFVYDSSIFPFASGRYGIEGYPLGVQRVATSHGRHIVEIPMTVLELGSWRVPAGGGGWFRLLPQSVTRAAIRRANARGRSAILYFHPYEFSRDPLMPRLTRARQYATGARYLLFHNFNRHRNRRGFRTLLSESGPFTLMREIAAHG